MRRGVAGCADDLRTVSLSGNGRTKEEVKGKGNWEVFWVSKGKEGLIREGGVRVREAPPEAEGAPRHAPIKQAGAPSAGGGGGMIEGKKGTGRYHCRSCALRVWVASNVQTIQVKQASRGVSHSLIQKVGGKLA